MGGIKRRYVLIGDKIVVIVKEVIFNGNIKKGSVLIVVVVCMVKEVRRLDGFYICFDDNVCVFFNL